MLRTIPYLDIFDPEVVIQHGITEGELRRVWNYVTILQGSRSPVLRDIAAGCYYGTSTLLHEVIELRSLLEREPRLLYWSKDMVREFLRANKDAHVRALVVEYPYLQQKVQDAFGEKIGLGALVLANAGLDDFWFLAESELPSPIFWPSDDEVYRAMGLLARLRALKTGGEDESPL